jgi:hypothetical protein
MTFIKFLLVEGSDDQHVIWNLLKFRNFPHCFEVQEKGGVDRLLSSFPVQLKGSAVQALGIVIDADLDAAGRWAGIKRDLGRVGYTSCPTDLPADGLVLVEEGFPRFGVWIMPNNVTNGMLEDFVAWLVPPNDPLWAHSEQVLHSMPTELLEFSSRHVAKAQIHTWLAWKADPGTPMGLAITKKYLDGGDARAEPFLGWLHRLFVE